MFARVAWISSTEYLIRIWGSFIDRLGRWNLHLSDKNIIRLSNLRKDDFFILSIKSFRSIYLQDFSDFLVVVDDEKRFKHQPIRWPVHDHVTTRILRSRKDSTLRSRKDALIFVVFERWIIELLHIDQIPKSNPYITLMTDDSEFVEAFLKDKFVFSI